MLLFVVFFQGLWSWWYGGEILVVNDLEELFHAVLVEEKHTVGGPDEGAFVLVEEMFFLIIILAFTHMISITYKLIFQNG